jgi:adenylate kinase family enzyme
MKRIVVIGSGGAGKSTFSRRLGEATGIEVIHLDSVFWRPGWEPTPKPEWATKVAEMVRRDSWIMDGNFGGTRKARIKACDAVIMLDVPRYVCLYRVIKRAIKFRGKSRPDMAAGCNEKIDLEFLSWVWNYPRRGRKRAFEEIKEYPEKRFVVLKSAREADEFLRKCKSDGFSR